jgi:hypothetical protein
MKYNELVDNEISDYFDKQIKSDEKVKKIASVITSAFDKTRKSPIPDLAKRINDTYNAINLLAKNVHISFSGKKTVVMTTGSADILLNQLRYGSSWFNPIDNIDDIILFAVMTK